MVALAKVFLARKVELAHGYASWCVAWSRLTPKEIKHAKSERANTPPSEAQVDYLKRLGWELAPPLSKSVASRLINELLNTSPVTAAQRHALLALHYDAASIDFITRGEARRELERLMRQRTEVSNGVFDGVVAD